MQEGISPLLPQEITSSSGETGPERSTIPLQKALPHKDVRNVLTPPKVLSRPPQS